MVGTLGVAAGLGLAWTALALGNAIGTVFVAAHSAQGPQLGIPQMIQSRAQFGVIGAGLPLVAVVVTYLLYSAADGLIIEGTLRALAPIDNNVALVVFAVATLVIAYVGYELIHRIGTVLTFVSGAFFAVAACLLLSRPAAVAGLTAQPMGHLSAAAFVLMMTQAAAWSLSYGPFVADYSRYLPKSASATATFWYTGLGCFLGSTAIMLFGAYLAVSNAGSMTDPSNAVASIFGPGRQIARCLILVGVIYGNVLNLYSAYMSTSTIFSGIRRMSRIGAGRKLAIMFVLISISTAISMLAQSNFQAYFADILSAMLYLLVPWSAINLADYYLVHKGRYIVADMFRIDGVYGAYRWKTIIVFLLGIALQVPFMSFSFFRGTFAQWIGADLAWAPGLLMPGLLHVLVERRFGKPTRGSDVEGPLERAKSDAEAQVVHSDRSLYYASDDTAVSYTAATVPSTVVG